MTHPLTHEQSIIVTAFTGVMCCHDFSDVHEYIERKTGRPVMTHELADKDVWREIKDACRDDFMALVPDSEENNDGA